MTAARIKPSGAANTNPAASDLPPKARPVKSRSGLKAVQGGEWRGPPKRTTKMTQAQIQSFREIAATSAFIANYIAADAAYTAFVAAVRAVEAKIATAEGRS